MLPSKRRIAILGGGPSGVTAARQIAKASDAEVDLIEAEAELGGLHKGPIIGGQAYDIGAFVFGPTHDLLRTFPELAVRFVEVRARYRRITPTGRLDIYPISVEGYVRDYGFAASIRALADLCVSKFRFRNQDSVTAYVSYRIGAHLYVSSGLKAYVERLYGIADTEVGIEFARQRLRYLDQISISQGIRSAVHRVISGSGKIEDQSVLIKPEDGFSRLYSSIRGLLESDGVRVFAPARLERMAKLNDGGVEISTDQFVRRYDSVISTIPLVDLLALLNLPQHGRCEWVRLVTLFYRGKVSVEGDFIYNFTFDGRWKRMTVFSRLYAEPSRLDRFSVEITMPQEEMPDTDRLRREFERHVMQYRVCSEFEMLGCHVTDKAYPLFRHGQSEGVAKDRASVESLGIQLAGRQGRFEYLSSAEAAAQASRLADKELARQSDASHD